ERSWQPSSSDRGRIQRRFERGLTDVSSSPVEKEAGLLLLLSGPMQSWGTQSRFAHRDTDFEPSKSGVLGLVGSALGMSRDDDDLLQALASLKMGVRVDREGRILRDYHTAGG